MQLDTDLILIAILIITIAVGVISASKSQTAGATSLRVLAISLAVWAVAYLVEENQLIRNWKQLGTALVYMSVTSAAAGQFVFSLSYSNRAAWASQRTTLLLAIMPILTQILYWFQPSQIFLFRGETLVGASPLALTGMWASVVSLYTYSLVGASALLLADTFLRKPRPLFVGSWPVPIGAVLPLAAEMMNLIGIHRPVTVEPALVAFTLAGCGFTYGLFNRRLIESIPVTREAVVEGMNEGWIVLDSQKIIIDINPAAELMLQTTREKAYGQHVSNVLGELPNLGNTFEGSQELEMKRSFRSKEKWRYLNIRISSLTDSKNGPFGYLIVWRDITERRLAEDARQRARDEMFVLLNAISSEASQAMTLEDFLSESIYQIVYPFRSQVVAIFLADEKKQSPEEQKFLLASHFGLPMETVESMPALTPATPLFGPALQARQPLPLDHIGTSTQVPAAFREFGCECMLVIPLVTLAGDENRNLGFICLGRKEGPGYTQDEIVRLSTISDHLANLIDSERRRKLAIALSERQRLMRDLHDSVSQKLYGLVTLTEAAQAAVEAGTSMDPTQVLARIGDNARQAVKEMRLFLYQMQPVDLEKDGLISVLHHRLAAVEGRADMKARLLADEHISLATEKEVALYFIAQEALNNILRHARAHNVLVTLKQGRKNVILEIEDDGRGFDPKKVDRAGLGLANMSERAAKIKGKFKILSKPDEGTKIVVTVARDEPVTPPRHRR